ncbi:Universal stress protein A-like protein [Quillaja saponaria]|uniref:Universal stress protein A-like protein n=1 Tax=Quillaja saponaria TaxID=32244 RepID=A0AAD7Q1H6_QUISA|nr:Universal stress protein A-like protein [Quillaja saponaria]
MERKERKIVVAVDESEESMYALSWCISNLVSDSTNNRLLLLYVKPPSPIHSSFDAAGYIFSRDVIAAMTKYTNELVGSVMERAEAIYRKLDTGDISVEKIVGSGDAKDVICCAVDKLKADTLVMGSHGYGFFKRAILGSVSDHCAKHAKCPVVIVKHP